MDKSEDAEVSSSWVRTRHVLLSEPAGERRPHGRFSTSGPVQDISAVVDGLEGMKLSQALVLGLPDFELIRVIGRGSYAKVLLVRLKKNEQVYAMKVVKKELVHDDEVRTQRHRLSRYPHDGTGSHSHWLGSQFPTMSMKVEVEGILFIYNE